MASQTQIVMAVETYRHKNIGPHIRNSVAFGSSQLLIVGSPLYSTFGAHGSQSKIRIIHFYEWSDCLAQARSNGFNVYSISPFVLEEHKSQSVETTTFTRSCLFIVGDKTGLTNEIKAISDAVLHVTFPNVQFATKVPYESIIGICLNKATSDLTSNSVYLTQRPFSGEKYDIDASIHFRGCMNISRRKDAGSTRRLTAEEVLDQTSNGMGDLFLDIEDIPT